MTFRAQTELVAFRFCLRLVELVNIRVNVDIFLFFRVFKVILALLYHLETLPVRLDKLITTEALEMDGVGATVDELTGVESLREEVDVRDFSLNLPLTVLPAALVRGHLLDYSLSGFSTLPRLDRLEHSYLLQFLQRMAFRALFRTLSRVVFFTSVSCVKVYLKIWVHLLLLFDFLQALFPENLTMVTLTKPIGPCLHQTHGLMLGQRRNDVEEVLFGFFLFLIDSKRCLLLTQIRNLVLKLVAHVLD